MRHFRLLLTLILCVLVMALVMFSSVNGQTATPDPIDLTGTALVAEVTQTIAAQGFSAQSAPSSEGTATPLAGLCNSLSYRLLDDVAGEVESALVAEDIIPHTVEVSAIEDTTDCLTFNIRTTSATLLIAVDVADINDESYLGELLSKTLQVLAQTSLVDLPDVQLTLGVVAGTQSRLFDLPFNAALMDYLAELDADTGWITGLTTYPITKGD
jgi:hypothetical protein